MSDIPSATPAKPSAADFELTLGQVKDVYASCVILDPNQELSEIHIVASTARKPKQIVRDIETLIFVKHKVKVDYRKVSLVQIPDEKSLRMPMARPEIREVTEEIIGNCKRIRVKIKAAGRIAVGEAQERIDHPTSFRTCAQATINTIEKLLDHSIDIRLEEAQPFRLGTREVLLVILTCVIENREETFVGSSFVNARPIESAAKATLDALNRRIYNLPIQAPRQSEQDA